MKRKKAVRKISSAYRSKIDNLVDHIKDFLPLNAYGSTVTFQIIFQESKVDDYLSGANKTQKLTNGFIQVLKYHKSLPHKIIRKVVPEAIQYRKRKRNPIKQRDIDLLSELLFELKIDLRKELGEIVVDENLPKITIPPSDLLKRLRQHNLVIELQDEVLKLYEDGHYNDAIRKCAEKFEVTVQNKSGLTDFGKNLMAKAFNLQNPRIKLNDLITDNDKGFQEGVQLMTMGMMRGIRNIFSHGDEDHRTPEECFEMIIFLNWLFRIIED